MCGHPQLGGLGITFLNCAEDSPVVAIGPGEIGQVCPGVTDCGVLLLVAECLAQYTELIKDSFDPAIFGNAHNQVVKGEVRLQPTHAVFLAPVHYR